MMKEEEALSINHEEKLLLESLLKQKIEMYKRLRKTFAGDEDYCADLEESLRVVQCLAMKIDNVLI